jgi:hypothetical protein
MIRVSAMALCLVAAALAGCRAAPPPPTRAELLQKLNECRDAQTSQHPAGHLAGCTKLDLSPLNGISRADLAASLGPPSFCSGLSEGGAPGGADCPPQLNPRWSFHGVGSVGPDLSCDTDEKQHCEVVRWINSE